MHYTFETALKKLISGGDNRRSRFHTENNVFIGWDKVITETPKVIGQKIRNGIVGTRSIEPWWPLPAISAIDKILRPDMKCIEFGSGSSTIWIARRVGSVVAREHNENWANITRSRIRNELSGLINCEIQNKKGQDYYSLDINENFDFAVVDGEYRWKCIEALAGRINPGGLIYFDNSDSDKDAKHYSEFGLVGSFKAQAAIKNLFNSTCRIEEVHGMINGELFAGSGMLLYF